MRKMIPDGMGNRIHFSIPDHEWQWFEVIENAKGNDAVAELNRWLCSDLAETAHDLRVVVRSIIGQHIESSATQSHAQRRPS